MFTFNGIGTKLYGATDRGTDGSYVATKWFVFVYLPVIPLGSLRVIKTDSTNLVVYNAQNYRVESVPLHKKQVIRTYLWVYGTLAAVMLLISLLQR